MWEEIALKVSILIGPLAPYTITVKSSSAKSSGKVIPSSKSWLKDKNTKV